MKKFLVITMTAMMSLTVFAQQPPQTPAPVEPPATLGVVMKTMSSLLRKISAQATDATLNIESEKLSEDLVAMIKNAKDHTPKKASDADKQQQYLKMIDDTVVLAQELASAFHNNDNAKAADILNKLSAAKKDGHAAFK